MPGARRRTFHRPPQRPPLPVVVAAHAVNVNAELGCRGNQFLVRGLVQASHHGLHRRRQTCEGAVRVPGEGPRRVGA